MEITDLQLRAIHLKASTLAERYADALCNGTILDHLTIQHLWDWDDRLSDTTGSHLSVRLAFFKYQTDEILSVSEAFIQESRSLSGWIQQFRDILTCYSHLPGSSPLPTRRSKPFPFEELLYPFITYARNRLRSTCDNLSLLCDDALEGHLQYLLHRLTDVAAACFYREFDTFRNTRKSGSSDRDPGSDQFYRAFIRHQFVTGILPFFLEYSVLARLLTTITNQWIHGTAVFIGRLSNDAPSINNTFFKGKSPGPVKQIRSGVTARHTKEGEVHLLEFESGKRLVYKPRCAESDVALAQILDWLTTISPELLPLAAVPVMDRGDYSWHAYVPCRSCAGPNEVKQFYQRVGQLAAILRLLGSMDYHLYNLRADESHPMLLDNETLFSPLLRMNALDSSRNYSGSLHALSRSLFLLDARHLRSPDIPAISGVFDDKDRFQGLRYSNPNSDAMKPRKAFVTRTGKNIPRMNGIRVSPHRFTDEMINGFENTLKVINKNKNGFTEVVKQATYNFNITVRMLLRPTAYYLQLASESIRPEQLRDGFTRSLLFEQITRMYFTSPMTKESALLLWEEQQMMEQQLIPWFHLKMGQTYYPVKPFSDERSMVVAQSAKEIFEENMRMLSPTFIRNHLVALRGYFAESH